MERSQILKIVLDAVHTANHGRVEGQRLDESPTGELFGGRSPLDSLGLVALLIDIEEAFQQSGCAVVLSDDRAMSQARSPFRDVPSLVTYIESLVLEQEK